MKSAAKTVLTHPKAKRAPALKSLLSRDVMGALSIIDDGEVYHAVIDPAEPMLRTFDTGVYYDFLCAAAAAVRYVIDMRDHYTLRDMEASGKLHVVECDLRNKPDHVVRDSATRCGYLVAGFDSLNDAYAFINK